MFRDTVMTESLLYLHLLAKYPGLTRAALIIYSQIHMSTLWANSNINPVVLESIELFVYIEAYRFLHNI